LVVGLALLASACASGVPNANAVPGAITINVVMREMSFAPKRFAFRVGDTVTFHFENKGKLPHEAVIGDQSAQDAAVAAMNAMPTPTTTTLGGARGESRVVLGARRHPGMGLPNVIYLVAGATGDLTFQFAKPTVLLMECHQPGHLEAGMKATVVITQ